ncbi:Planctomycete cytochrome C [Pirellula sp. SH-Sr6A]|uniref:PSD1 and planctomycete cytochrome C domain-containing protein n=1 Tax=Pirellula sp. SH-Sr6A TaxID=1632865 RepID=UPI00078DDB45|nr:PSD1 and planctomycete cytochrome C domain-containing protein [Pirellula sp. SH-Sr6A]AMV30985.1 Planctomycete cytochrome C [Pirellula sp. SH-Sr6A]
MARIATRHLLFVSFFVSALGTFPIPGLSQQESQKPVVATEAQSNDPPASLVFEKQVRPILKAHCFLCHGEEAEKGGELDLRLVRLMQQGGESGPAIDVSNPAESLLLQRILADEMPPGPKKLTTNEKELIREWLQGGAKTRRPEPENPKDVRFTDEELSHWAFQPIRRPESMAPASGDEASAQRIVAQGIDQWVSRTAEANGFQLAPPADRHVLLRRLSFNLTGLPPTREELQSFLADESDEAYAKVVDRLLASPNYGVRWGRHWLDVAGYAESDGQILGDRARPHAWRYRDYVVDALNRDLPYSQFLREQIAGDQMVEGTIDPNNDEHARLMAATGFLQMAPDLSETENTILNRNQTVADTIQTVTSSVLGLTVACAQCHDHRYDPISIADYYKLRAIFDPALPLHQWKAPTQRLIDLTNDATKSERAKIEEQAVALQEDINARRRAHCQTIQDREINAAPEEVRETLRTAVQTAAKDQTPEQKALLESYPKVRTVDWIVGQLVEYDGPSHRKFQEEEKKVQEIRDSKPLARLVMSAQDRDKSVKSHVFFRGNPESPQQEVEPSELEVLLQNRPADASRTISGEKRRLAYAEMLTDGNHPLVARVIVNRVWMHHFGAGLVRSPGDFGLNGQPPTHPELLDYLAYEFMAHGWSLKWLHRQIVHSQTFRQASAHPQDAPGGVAPARDSWHDDPENRFLARMSLRRLDAEAVRDAVLAVSGQLNPELGGPSIPVAEDDEGKAVIGSRILRDGLFAGIKDPGENGKRRSIYLSSQRSMQLSLLQTFDFPEMKPNCQQRTVSTVTPQALLLMNDAWVVQAAEQMSERIWSEGGAPEARAQTAFELALGVAPKPTELAGCLEFVLHQSDLFRKDTDEKWQKKIAEQPDAPDRRGLASLCQMLIASNRFLYLE